MNEISLETLVDVRPLPPRERHPAIFDAWNSLAPGGSLVVANDHDPVPLYYQFACEHPGTFRWAYLEQGPQTWRVRLTKGQFTDPGYSPRAKMALPGRQAAPATGPIVLDVRPIFARGETPCAAIDAAVAQVATGQSLVLLVPFEPVPLYSKLGRQGFESSGEPQDDGSWKITFTRTRAGESSVACGCGGH